jgi:hypothetical protein
VSELEPGDIIIRWYKTINGVSGRVVNYDMSADVSVTADIDDMVDVKVEMLPPVFVTDARDFDHRNPGLHFTIVSVIDSDGMPDSFRLLHHSRVTVLSQEGAPCKPGDESVTLRPGGGGASHAS